ncbi:MAG: N-acyl-D-aspartate/D-glutamate deacylase, partial [Halioglobus sp.]
MLDVLIKNALIVDGTGAKPFSGDIGIANGVIAEVGS